jgi:hypothetical protein
MIRVLFCCHVTKRTGRCHIRILSETCPAKCFGVGTDRCGIHKEMMLGGVL